MLLVWIDYTYCNRVFCGRLGLTKRHKRYSARVELSCLTLFSTSQREPEGTKRLQSCFERVLIKHRRLESKTRLLGVITEAINETNNLFSFRNAAADALNYLPQSDDVTALNLQIFGCCGSGDALQRKDGTPCRNGGPLVGGRGFASGVRSRETASTNQTASLEQCRTFDCRSMAGATPPAQRTREGKSKYRLATF